MKSIKYRLQNNTIIIRGLLAFSIFLFFIYNLSQWQTCERTESYLPFNFISASEPAGSYNIFFIESSEPCDKVLRVNPRQICSIESAARQNPDWQIYFYVVEANGYFSDIDNIRLWDVIKSFKNVHVKVINAKNFTLNTPLEQLFEKGLNSPSSYLKYHRSDLLRYTLLWKYAGTYLDLDVISQKPLKNLGYNFAVEQVQDSDEIIAGAGIINFDSDFIGREIAAIIMADLQYNFNGRKWDDSSVRVLSRALAKICGTNKLNEVTPNKCQGFKLYPYDTFYAIHFEESEYFFEPKLQDIAMTMVNKSIGIHAWNKVTAGIRVKKTDRIALLEIAKTFCPLTFEASGEYF